MIVARITALRFDVDQFHVAQQRGVGIGRIDDLHHPRIVAVEPQEIEAALKPFGVVEVADHHDRPRRCGRRTNVFTARSRLVCWPFGWERMPFAGTREQLQSTAPDSCRSGGKPATSPSAKAATFSRSSRNRLT